MPVDTILAIVALICAILSLVVAGPLVTLAVILLALAFLL